MTAQRHVEPTFAYRPITRVAMLVVHSNPLDEPGAGDAGGMTVYVREVARTLAARGVAVDIFTRRDNVAQPTQTDLFPGVTVIQIPAGDPSLAKDAIPAYLPEFTCNVTDHVEARGTQYDMIHSHYWLSGRVASKLSARWKVPFIHTFHTLGRVKNESLRPGDNPEPEGRLVGEGRVIADAAAIVASTVEEKDSLIALYSAHPERIHLIPPGVDHGIFKPGDKLAAKAKLGHQDKKILLFVGRLQPLKAADTAIRALGALSATGRVELDVTRLLIVGGASGVAGRGEPERLMALAEDLGVGGAVEFMPAQPQRTLGELYQAADVCLVPSHTESFGLVALEAQACGVPVVGSAVGGLRAIIRNAETGFLVEPGEVEAFADRVATILSDERLAGSMARAAVIRSVEYSWDRSAAELHELYCSSASEVSTGVSNAGRNVSWSRKNLSRSS